MRALTGSLLIRATLSAALVLTGCLSIERSYPDKRFFVLDLDRSSPAENPGGNGILQVATVRVSPRYADRNFVYRRGDARFEADFYNQFLVSPAALVTEELRRELAASGIFHHVVDPVSPLPATHTLESSVNALYGDFRDLGAPRAVIEMEFFLTQPQASPNGRIIFHRSYRQVAPVASRTPEALVHGWNQALEEILRSLTADLNAINEKEKNAARR